LWFYQIVSIDNGDVQVDAQGSDCTRNSSQPPSIPTLPHRIESIDSGQRLHKEEIDRGQEGAELICLSTLNFNQKPQSASTDSFHA
jgi:hypothetical protein